MQLVLGTLAHMSGSWPRPGSRLAMVTQPSTGSSSSTVATPGPKGSLHWMIATRTHHKRLPAPAPHHDEPGRVPRVPRQQGQEAERPGLDQTGLLHHHTRGPGVLKVSMKFCGNFHVIWRRHILLFKSSYYKWPFVHDHST